LWGGHTRTNEHHALLVAMARSPQMGGGPRVIAVTRLLMSINWFTIADFAPAISANRAPSQAVTLSGADLVRRGTKDAIPCLQWHFERHGEPECPWEGLFAIGTVGEYASMSYHKIYITDDPIVWWDTLNATRSALNKLEVATWGDTPRWRPPSPCTCAASWRGRRTRGRANCTKCHGCHTWLLPYAVATDTGDPALCKNCLQKNPR
jgi:hypothetical protein